ncbi:MAG: YegS/Rv2252/BmrU family lipid kinase [Lachnospiraceae bacterium]|nr:YegS/Rv2252/BmrU family lipid kinase [Lachnospiraceae bacterium]
MYYFIVSAASAGGKGLTVWNAVKKGLSNTDVKYKAYRTEHKGHAGELAKKISELPDEDIRIVILGGDGTVNEVINGITDLSKVKLGVIPVGSGNDFCRGLGIKGSVSEILRGILERKGEDYTAVDLGEVETDEYGSRLFAISSGFGLDAIVCKTVDESKGKKVLNSLGLGKLSYGIQTVFSLFSMDTFRAGGESDLETRLYNDVIFAAVMNMRAEGGGVPMAPGADPFDGHLSVCCAHDIPKWKTFMYFPKLLAAKHENIEGFDIFETFSLNMVLNKPVVLHTDGECVGEVSKLHFECKAGALKLINAINMT